MPSTEPQVSLRTQLANAMATIKKKHFGRGPTAARAYLEDDYLFVVLEGGLMPHEETLLASGHEDEVRRYRLVFQEAVGDMMTSSVEELTGRRVLGYHSQITFNPTRVFEIFVLEPGGG